MENRTRTTIRIHGKEYHLKGNESEEYIHRVAICVDKKVNQVVEKNPTLSVSMVGIITSINLADELLKLKDEYSAFNSRIEDYEREIAENKKQIKELQSKIVKYTMDHNRYKKDKPRDNTSTIVDMTKKR